MPDKRRHRGAHPRDRELFAESRLPVLREAASEYSWLLGRGYAQLAALTLVGDHHQLHRRQRMALLRSVCSPQQAAERVRRRVPVAGAEVMVDGFNVLVGVESLLSGGLLLRGPDGLVRDLASVHGSYRSVLESPRALELLVQSLAPAASARWVLDAPVSNSGRVAAALRAHGQEVEVRPDADSACIASGLAVASSDGPLLDRAAAGVDLLGPLVERLGGWCVELT